MEPVIQVYELRLDQIQANPWNPNEQDEETFNALVEEIEQEGFDEPILVVPQDEAAYKADAEGHRKTGLFTIIGGEHRWKAMGVLGKLVIPCVIKEAWDEVKQKIKTVRRNLLRGELNPQKFTKLVNDIKRMYDVDAEVLGREMGFRDGEFMKFYKERKEKEDRVAKDVLDDTRREISTIDNLSSVLNEILGNYGETVPNGFVFFVYKGECHLMVNCTKSLDGKVKALVDLMTSQGLDATKVFTEMLTERLKEHGQEKN